jgi:oxygen-independent coproporphyrinogen-3 oxidase
MEPRTVFGHRAARGELAELPEPHQATLFRLVHEYLADAGYPAYEVSNFARSPEDRSRHNRKYWNHVPYLGLGPSAHSYDGGRRRWWNERGLSAWKKKIDQGEKPIAGEEELGDAELGLEALMLGLRTARGIGLEAFRRRYGVDLLETDGDLIAELVRGDLAVVDGGQLSLTLDGLTIAEALVARFDL